MNGAIVICDALGFKGIWGRFNHQAILTKLAQLADHVRWVAKSISSDSSDYQASRADSRLKAAARVFSDTVVFAVWSETVPPQVAPEHEVLTLACLMTVALIDQAQQPEIPLAYRGCVAFGEFYVTDDLIVGPAIDEAAENMNTPDGAFVWLAPSAEIVIAKRISDGRFDSPELHTRDPLARVLIQYSVPLKDGRSLTAWVVDPFAQIIEGRLLTTRTLAGFSGTSCDVRVKRENTARFLDHAYETRALSP